MSMFESVKSSGALAVGTTTLTAGSQTGPSRVHYVTVVPAAAASTVIVYDGTAATGTVVASLAALANGASVSASFHYPVICLSGVMTVVVAGTGAVAVVHYSLQ